VDSYRRFLLPLELAAAAVVVVLVVVGEEVVVVVYGPVAYLPVAPTPPLFVTDHPVDLNLAGSFPVALHYLMQPVGLVHYLSKPSLKLDVTNQSH